MGDMANPIGILIDLEEKLRQGILLGESCDSDINYKKFCDEFPGGKRYIYAKVVNSEVQAISIFGLEEPFKGVERYSVGYAVRENCRGRALSIEAFNQGIAEVGLVLKRARIGRFYVEALIDEKNIPSIKVAEKLFSHGPIAMLDEESGTPSKLFYRLVEI